MDFEQSVQPHSELGLDRPVTDLGLLLRARRLDVDGQAYLVEVERHLQFADEPIGLGNQPTYSVAVSRAADPAFRATQADMDEASLVRAAYCEELGYVTNGGSYVTGEFRPANGNDLPDWNFADGCVFEGVKE